MEQLRIIKAGGNVINDQVLLNQFLKDVASLPGKKILVHGGGNLASEISLKLGVKPTLVNGRRITDEATLRIVTMVYAGLINKTIVSRLNSESCNAIGLTGTDGLIYPGTRRTGGEIDYGYVADLNPEKINTALIDELLIRGIVPVFAPITSDLNGELLNINADTVASALASALSKNYKTQLIVCFEKPGVLMGKESEEYIPMISTTEINLLIKQNIVSDGMIPKLENARNAINEGVDQVIICNPAALNSLITTGNIKGTLIHA